MCIMHIMLIISDLYDHVGQTTRFLDACPPYCINTAESTSHKVASSTCLHQQKKQGYIDYIILHKNHRCIAW